MTALLLILIVAVPSVALLLILLGLWWLLDRMGRLRDEISGDDDGSTGE